MNDFKSLKNRVVQSPRFLLSALLMLAVSVTALAQTLTVHGTVVDPDGEPVIGGTVLVPGTTKATATDIDGNYTLAGVPSNGKLEFRYVGFQNMTEDVNGRTQINVTMKQDSQLLDEVVVVGYGVQKKSDVTGSLSHVGADELQSRPVTNAFEALQGKAAGVDITSSERPGTVGTIRIRGERSLKAGNSPLYVVDGVPLMSGSGIETLNPRDIESVDILKDASATAIYGSRGANGVVIITTKQGKPGNFSLNYSGSVTWQNLVDRSPSMSAEEMINYRRWAAYNSDPTKYADPRNPTAASDQLLFDLYGDPTATANVMRGWAGGTWDASRVTDYNWTDDATRTGFVQEHTLSASGGTDKMNAFGSFGYLDNKGTQRGQKYNRYTARLGVNITPVKWFTLQMSINASREFQDYGVSSRGSQSTTNARAEIYSLYKTNVNYALPYDENGARVKTPGGGSASYSTINEWEHNVSERETYRVLGSFSGLFNFGEIWAPLKGLNYKISFGPDYRHYRQGDFLDLESAYMIQKSAQKNTVNWNTRRDFSWTLDNMITYNRTFNKVHNVGLTLLQTASKWDYETASMSADGVPIDKFTWNAMGLIKPTDSANNASWSTGLTERQLESYMIRVNYGFNDRYLLTASGRWDGASQLSKGRKWAFFPSLALAWRIQQENFLNDVQWLTDLKIRLGVGTTGNSAIDPYSTLNLLQTIFVPTGTGYSQGLALNEPAYFKDNLVMSNTEVGWEKTTQWNAGVDFGFFNNRLNGSVEVYFSKTKDLLLDMIVPTVTGYGTTTANVGKTSNKGVEVTINALPVVTRDFEWNTSFNMGWQKDKIDELAYGKNDDIANARFIGEALSVFYDYKTDGLWQDTPEDQAEMAKWNENGYNFSPGMVKPVDQNGDYKMQGDDDRVIIGNKRPTLTAGWTNSFNYKGIELSFQMYGRFNYYVHAPQYLFGYGNLGNAVDYWTPDNTGAEFQKPILTSEQTGTADMFASQNGYKKANFVRMRNISVGYTFPQKLLEKATIKNLKIYGQVINPFDIYQSVDGLDLDTGLSFYNRSWVIGLEIGF